MLTQEKVQQTRTIFLEYVNNDGLFMLDELYNQIEKHNCYYYLSPNLSIAKFIDILEFNGMAKIYPNNHIDISKLGKIHINEIYASFDL